MKRSSSGTVVLMLSGILVASVQTINAATVNLDVAKTLQNGDPLTADKITRIGVLYDCVTGGDSVRFGQITISLPSSLQKSEVKLYFANDVKNILQVTVTEDDLTGTFHQVPHSSPITFGTSKISKKGGDRVFTLNQNWFPKNAHKISASVKDEDVTYNFYGIKNYPISIPDTMVVENFKNVSCSA